MTKTIFTMNGSSERNEADAVFANGTDAVIVETWSGNSYPFRARVVVGGTCITATGGCKTPQSAARAGHLALEKHSNASAWIPEHPDAWKAADDALIASRRG